MTPTQQKAFSSWWLNEKYGGNLSNVPGLTLNENGIWVGEPGRVYDINPENGRKGKYIWMGTSAVSGFVDVTPPLYVDYVDDDGNVLGQVEMQRNRHGLYSTDDFLTENNERKVFTINPNTGEEGEWIWLGTMGWINKKGDPQPEPEPGTLVFGGGGQMVGPYDPDYDADAASSEVDDTPDAGTETPAEGVAPPKALTASPQQTISSSQGAFTSSTPMGLRYSAPPAPQMVSTAVAPKMDYAKALNNALALDVMGNMLTGRKV